MRRRFALLLLVPLVGFAACGDDDDDDGGGEASADCHVTIEEAGAAVGLDLVESAEVIDSDGGESCSWEATVDGNDVDATVFVDVTWFAGTGADAIDDAGSAWSDAASADVAGADEALASAENSGLVARAGDDAVRVFVSGPDIVLDDPQGVAVVLAQVALGEMQLEGE